MQVNSTECILLLATLFILYLLYDRWSSKQNPKCRKCGGRDYQKITEFFDSEKGLVIVYQCKKCGADFRYKDSHTVKVS